MATKYCDSEYCHAEAVEKVRVSVNAPHDETRNYCYACYELYLIGVQHGRFHEAAIHGSTPDRGCSQIKPGGRLWKQLNKQRQPTTAQE